VYLTQSDKFKAIIEDIASARRASSRCWWAPLDRDLRISLRLLQKEGVEHQVLNAKQHEREAHIVAQAAAPAR